MLITKKISKENVLVSFDLNKIYIRKSGKAYFGKEELLVEITEDSIIINEEVANKYGLDLKTILE